MWLFMSSVTRLTQNGAWPSSDGYAAAGPFPVSAEVKNARFN